MGDSHILTEMRAQLSRFQRGGLDTDVLADRLVLLRDQLEFSDPPWYHELTQHIVTIDSASTYRPKNDAEAEQSTKATMHATTSLLDLVTRKNEQLQQT